MPSERRSGEFRIASKYKISRLIQKEHTYDSPGDARKGKYFEVELQRIGRTVRRGRHCQVFRQSRAVCRRSCGRGARVAVEREIAGSHAGTRGVEGEIFFQFHFRLDSIYSVLPWSTHMI